MLRAKESGVHLYLKDGQLAFKATKTALDSDLRNEIVRFKPEIISLLLNNDEGEALVALSGARDELPCSFAQQRMWLIDQIEPGTYKYNIPNALKLVGELDQEILHKALSMIVERHEIIRTHYTLGNNGEPLQCVKQDVELTLSLTDLVNLTESEQSTRVAERIAYQSQKPFSLANDLMLRAELIKLHEQMHVLIVTMHHIASDGWSMGILTNELTALYGALARGEQGQLEALPVQYGDFACWQRKILSGSSLEHLLNYWKAELAGMPQLHNLPTDFPRPTQPTYNGGRVMTSIDSELLGQLKQLANREDATLFMALHAAFSAFISIYSGDKDIVIGTPVSNREQSELEQLIGCFVNTLVLRSDLSDNPTCAELVQQSKRRLLGAYEHQQLPFERLVDELQPQRSLSHSPLFQVMLVMQNYAAGDLSLGDMQILPVEQDAPAALFDLNLIFAEQAEGAVLTWCFAEDLFETATIERFSEHFETVLSAFARNPQQLVSDISFLSEQERQYLLKECNDTTQPYPDNITIIDWFEKQVALTPEAMAVVSEESALTYQQLNARANGLATHIQSLGSHDGRCIGIMMDRCVEMVVSILACMKAGAAYVPLDPQLPEAQMTYIVSDTQLELILSTTAIVESNKHAPQHFVDVCSHDILQKSQDNNASRGTSHLSPAYVIYTSGSTGKPKGVVCGHQGLVNRVHWMQETFNLTHSDVILQKTPFNFDVSVWEFFWPLVTGAKLVMAKPNGHKDPAYVVGAIKSHKVTVLHFVPSMLEHLLQSQNWQSCDSVKHVICSGEALSLSTMHRFQGTGTRAKLHNLYGPTEASIDVSYWYCENETDLSSVPIGYPIDNTELHILNSNLELVPLGVAGELYIGGVGLAHGYCNQPELTAERFIKNPISESSSERLYKTGDLVRRRKNGEIEFLGRIDHQVKVRGLRIELGAIENVLMSHPSVDKAVVVADEQQQSISAFVVAAAQPELLSELRKTLSQHLPDYMRPDMLNLIDDIPLTYSGKVNRRALLSIEHRSSQEQVVIEQPRNAQEELLFELWAEALGQKHFGIDDSFFENGGHSLKAISLIMKMNQAFSVQLSVSDLFEYQTIRKIAVRIDELDNDKSTLITTVDEQIAAPLSYSQQRLWLINHLDPQNTQYNMPYAMCLSNRVDTVRLESAVQMISQRHSILRTIYKKDDKGDVTQHILKQAQVPISYIQIGGHDPQAQIDALYQQELHTPFNLTEDLPIRVLVASCDNDQTVVIMTLHHIAADGWSMNILSKELVQLYLDSECELDSTASEVTYRDFSFWQRQEITQSSLADSVSFWQARLAGIPVTHNLPLDTSRPAQPSYRGGVVTSTLSADTSKKIKAFATAQGMTEFMFLQAAFSALLYRMSGESDVVIGCPVANRDNEQLKNMVGCFINNLVIRAQVNGDVSFLSHLTQCKDYLLDAYKHQQVPFELLVDKLNPPRSASHTPLFQVLMNAEVTSGETSAITALDASGISTQEVIAKYDLTLTVGCSGSDITLNWEYAKDLFSGSTIERYDHYFQQLLQAVLVNNHVKIDDISLLSEAAEKSLLSWGNHSKIASAQPECLHTAFERFALIEPKQVAVIHGDNLASYEALNNRANQLAHGLVAQGVGPGDIVGISLPRNIDMVASILAVLKVGAAYLPLDPAYPPQRLHFMMQDANASALIVREKSAGLTLDATLQVFELNTPSWFDKQPIHNVAQDRVKPEHTGYLIYTSGSTGQPKGVPLTHANASSMLDWARDFYSSEELSRVLASTSINFDLSIFELFLPLTSGTTILLVDDILSLAKDDQIRPTLINTVPSGIETLLELNRIPSSTRVFNVAGEPLSASLVNGMLETCIDSKVVNLYGPTEATTYSTWAEFTSPIRRTPEIGVPLANTCCYVLDSQQRLCPEGVAGELYIGGHGLAQGYLNREELTNHKFLSGTSHLPALYRTGDFVRWRRDGSLDFIGRSDEQIKLRGYRIELGEIESHLSSHAKVKKCIVTIVGNSSSNKQLVAYVTTDGEKPLRPETLQRELQMFLKAYVPDYMVPTNIIVLEAFPLTPNGKVDKLSLPKPDTFSSSNDYEPPKGEVETVLVATWARLLEVEPDQIGRADNFFVLGGHSLLVIKLAMDVNRTFNVVLNERELFDNATIELMALSIEQAMSDQGNSQRYSQLVASDASENAKKMTL
nr:non-ribosomal peptide synthetase [Pseudoalteromonas luteoviolacea]